MKNIYYKLLISLVLLTFPIINLTAQDQKIVPSQRVGKFTDKNEPAMSMEYLVYTPADYSDKIKGKYPLVFFLHGAGERGSDINLVRRNGLPKLVEEGRSFPFIMVSPQCPEGKWWDPEILYPLITDILRKYKIDKKRVYLTGLSMGGFGTWDLAYNHPELFAAIVPVCGGAYPYMAEKIREIPAWVFHGAKDNIVPLIRSQEMVDALRKAGGSVKFTVYPEAGHDSWTETYNNPDLYKWLLEQSK
jgi:predicted peptidase